MTPSSPGRRPDDPDPLPLAVFIGLTCIVATPAVIFGVLLTALMPRRTDYRRRWLLLLLAIPTLGSMLVLRVRYLVLWQQLLPALTTGEWAAILPLAMRSWLMTLPLLPTVMLITDLLLPRSAEDQALAHEVRRDAREQRRRQKARKQARHAPELLKDRLVLGAFVSGDLADWRHRHWLTYPAGELAQHAIAVGASGSGKTETLLRLATLAVTTYGYQVLFVDAKGDLQTAARFLAAMHQTGCRNVPLFPARPYDGWEGDGPALLNRLLALQPFTEPFYQDIAALTLRLAIDAPAGLPRSSTALLARLSLDALRALYSGHPNAYLVERLRAEEIRGVYLRYAGFFATLEKQLDGGWKLADVDAAYLLLDGTARREEAASLGRYLLEDISHYVTSRKPPERKVLVIIDEFSAISHATDASNLFERLRSFGAAVVIASQSIASLGRHSEQLLGAAATLLVHACSDPELLCARAGTVRQATATYELTSGAPTGGGTVRPEQVARVDPNAVRQLDVGECFVIAHGRAARVQIARLPATASDGTLLVQAGGWLAHDGTAPAQAPAAAHATAAPAVVVPAMMTSQNDGVQVSPLEQAGLLIAGGSPYPLAHAEPDDSYVSEF